MVDCSEARALISAGTHPGAGPGQSSELGFHLSGCPACRAFRRIDLFDREQARKAQAPTASIPTPSPEIVALVSPRVPHARANITPLRVGAVLVLIMCTWTAWYIGLPLLRAWQNLGTMTSLPPVSKVAASAADPELVVAATPTPEASVSPTSTEAASATPSQPLATPSPTASPRLAAGAARLFAPEPSNIPMPTATGEPTATATSEPTATPLPTEAPPPPTATVAPDPPAPAIASTHGSGGGVTILLLGSDARPGESTGRSDALIVVHVDPERQTAAMLSLPRDLWVAIPQIGEGKINGALAQGGSQTAAATVSQALGISIDQTAVIDFSGFSSLIDALGGVPVSVPRELYDAKFPTIDYGYTVAHFLPGPQLMNGAQALMYSRIRHPDSDFQRMRRQQAVLLGISAQLRKLGAFQSLHEADRITGALTPYVRTSMERGATVQLLWSLRNINLANVRQLVLDGGMLQETTIGGSYALVADPATLQSLGAQLLAP